MESGALLAWLLVILALSTCPYGGGGGVLARRAPAPTHALGTLGISASKLSKLPIGDLQRSRRSLGSPSSPTQSTTPRPAWQNLDDTAIDGSGLSLDGTIPEEDLSQWLSQEGRTSELSRKRRKVISRGGHYLIGSNSGSSPWSSSSYDSYSTYRTSRPRGYGWTIRGRIGDGGIRTTSFGEIEPKPEPRMPRKKLAKTFKGEIAQYAIQHGAKKAALHYERRVGRRLRERVVEKFVQRYRDRVKKKGKKPRS